MSDTDDEKTPGLFGRFARGLKRSSDKLASDIGAVLTGEPLDQRTLDDLEDVLIAADLGAAAAAEIVQAISKKYFSYDATADQIRQALSEQISARLKPYEKPFALGDERPAVVLFIGVNGSGKTTTLGKIAAKMKGEGQRAVLAAGDTFRAAAIEQIRVWGERADVPVMAREIGADAAGLIYDAYERAEAEGADALLADTAGRLQNRKELMAELEKIVRVVKKKNPAAPHHVLLVLDATVGQNALSQAEAFLEAANVTGLVMTKLDGTAKGGVLMAVAEKHRLPIHFIGVGESAEDLQPFDADAFARALVGLE